MSAIRGVIGAVLLLVWVGLASTAAGSVRPGEPAPRFVLPAVEGGAYVASDTLFECSGLTMLAFWTTHCAECVRRLEICQELADWGGEDGLRVLGMNFDERPTARIRLLARQATPRLVHLYDAGGRLAAAFGAGAHSFSLYLIDPRGVVRAVRPEIPADSLEQLRPALRALLDEAFEAAPGGGMPLDADVPAAEAGGGAPGPVTRGVVATLRDFARIPRGLEVHGRGRVRWMDIDTTGVGATGASGEEVEAGGSLRQRLELEIAYAITPHVSAGGLLWLSNEGEAVLRSGPDYLSSAWGSAFVHYFGTTRLPGLGTVETRLRGGYYDLSLTPLTLMRWDKDDSPISGGQKVQGCGVCGGEAGLAGFIRSESVERLGPDYTFEGFRWDLALAGRADLTAFYARPQRDWPTEVAEATFVEPAEMRFRQELYGGRLTGHFSPSWTHELLSLSATVLIAEDDTENWPWVKRPDYDPGRVRLLGGDLELPLPSRTRAYAELAASRWEPALPPYPPREVPERIDANAWRGGVTFDLRGWAHDEPLDFLPMGMTAKIDLAYQHLEAGYFAPYGAISYEANVRPTGRSSLPDVAEVTLAGLEGPRVGLRIDYRGVGLGAFTKQLRPLAEQALPPDETPGGERRMRSIWLDFAAWPHGTLMVGGVWDDRDPLEAQEAIILQEDRRIWCEERRTLVVSLEQELAPRCVLMLEAQFLEGSRGEDAVEEYASRTLRALLDVEF